jgi:predicted dehydrogenase
MGRRTNRRQFLQQSTLAGVGFWVAGGLTPAASKAPVERLNIACIGVGGKGSSDTHQAGKHANIVALCDIDDNTLNGMAKDFPQAKKYNDYRKMFDEMGKGIDAVTVSTPDHTHAPASVMAMKLGKHVYCQKPLTHTVYEARLMRDTAREKKVCTQMGNQGTATDGLRRGVEVIRSGALGPVKEVHVWTNRPIWPQGAEAILKTQAGGAAALAALHGKSLSNIPRPEAPKHVHWDLFLGTAPERPYDPIYHPFSWRGWWDFGTGALGDMACHTANLPFMALKLGSPTTITAESGEINPETYPTWAHIVYEFPAREEMPPVKFHWYEGHRASGKLLPPASLIKGKQFSDSGSLVVGEKGVLYSPSDYGGSFQLLPEDMFKDYKAPEPTLPRTGNRDNDEAMKIEWIEAIKKNDPKHAMSNFDYAALLTETILLGNVAMRAGKVVSNGGGRRGGGGSTRKIEWDAENLKATNAPEANNLIKPEIRKGWTL